MSGIYNPSNDDVSLASQTDKASVCHVLLWRQAAMLVSQNILPGFPVKRLTAVNRNKPWENFTKESPC